MEIVSRGREIDIRAYETADTGRILSELRPVVSRLSSDARDLLGQVLDACDAGGPPDTARAEKDAPEPSMAFEHALDATVAGGLGSREAVGEMAFMADMELAARLRRLAGLGDEASSEIVLEECDSTLRRIRKALTAVDAAIAGAEGIEPVLDYTSELASSLQVRRAYAKFRSRILEDGPPTADTLFARFRGAGTQLAILVGWDAWPEMRTRDRLMLRGLQTRILDWLRTDRRDTQAGLRLWQDLSGCLEMMGLVNRRQELVEHDSQVIRWGLERLDDGADTVDDTTLRLLDSLEGLDEALDLLLRERSHPPRDWRAVLERLAAPAAGTGPSAW